MPVAEIMGFAEGVAAAVRDGDPVALEGFTHLVPHAAGHELIRQGRRALTLVRLTPDVLAGLVNRYVAGASGLPFAVLRGYAGTGLEGRSEHLARTTCPFTGEGPTAVAAISPDAAVIHAQRADREGNVQLWRIVGIQNEAVLAATRALVTVEEVVDGLEPVPGGIVPPTWAVTAVAVAPGGAHPSYVAGYSERDNDFYVAWDAISRDRDGFAAWMAGHVLGAVPA